MTDKHKWTFAPRFRSRAFGWKSEPAIKRVREAVSEIKKVAKKDSVLGGAGAVLFLEKVTRALEQVDGSSGAIGTAVNHAIEDLVTIIASAKASDAMRDKWLERLFEALQNDDIPYIEQLAEHWGMLCVTPARASRWADKLLPTLRMAWADGPGAYFTGTPACLSSLLAASRFEELLKLLDCAPFVWWHDRKFGVQALAAMGLVDEALAYAERSLGRNDGHAQMARLCESILLQAGRVDEAYQHFAIDSNQGTNRPATFRAIVKKYPERDPKTIIADLIRSTPGEEGKWFATARELKLYDLAVSLVEESPCDPKTLNRAAQAHLATHPAFSLRVALASLRWLTEGWGYEITGFDVLSAYDCAVRASRAVGREAETLTRIQQLVANDNSVGMFVRQVLERRLIGQL